MSELTVAVAGCGRAGVLHLASWAALTGVRVAAVCDRDGPLVARTLAHYPGAAAFQDCSAMLSGARYDIVDICLPPGDHFAAASSALRTGANVLCEKPLTTTVEDANTLVQLAKERERLLGCAFCHRFHPPVVFAKELIENDDLGRPAMFRCRFSGYYASESTLADPERTGGRGVLLDTGIHAIDLFRYLMGEVDQVSGTLARVNAQMHAEDTAALWLRSSSGAVGVIETSWSTPGGRSALEIYGTAGACVVDYDEGTLRYITADHRVWRNHDAGGPNRFERQVAQFADAVRGLQPLMITGEDGARAVELCMRVYDGNG